VNRLGFGAMRLAGWVPFGREDAAPSDRAQSLAVLRRAVEAANSWPALDAAAAVSPRFLLRGTTR
jgi:hypothetical protein